MCRFAMYLGPPVRLSSLVTEPRNSIIHQSYEAQEREEPLNGDGFGVAWYVPELRAEPAVFKSVSPAWSNQNLFSLASVTRSHCLLAHVRAATPGLAVTQQNCHPFVRGELAFMHNGTVGGFDQLRRGLQAGLSDAAYQALEGSTDSEQVLAMFSDRWRGQGQPDRLRSTAAALVETIRELEALRAGLSESEPSYLNLVLTDGRVAAITRYVSPGHGPAHSLYFAEGQLSVRDGAGCVVESSAGEAAVVVASEPLGERRRWQAVPENHLLLIDEQRRVSLEAIPA